MTRTVHSKCTCTILYRSHHHRPQTLHRPGPARAGRRLVDETADRETKQQAASQKQERAACPSSYLRWSLHCVASVAAARCRNPTRARIGTRPIPESVFWARCTNYSTREVTRAAAAPYRQKTRVEIARPGRPDCTRRYVRTGPAQAASRHSAALLRSRPAFSWRMAIFGLG